MQSATASAEASATMAKEQDYNSTLHQNDDEDADDDEEEEEEAVSEVALTEAETDLRDQLFSRIRLSDAIGVLRAIRNGANVNCVDSEGRNSPLIYACENTSRCVGVVRTLLIAGADARWRDSDGRSAMSVACSAGHLRTIEMLIKHDSNLLEITDTDNMRWTPLLVAAAWHRRGGGQ